MNDTYAVSPQDGAVLVGGIKYGAILRVTVLKTTRLRRI